MSERKRPPEPHEIVQVVLKAAHVSVWNDPDGVPHVSAIVAGHREHFPVLSDTFTSFLTVAYLRETRKHQKGGSAPSDAIIRTTQNLLRAEAMEQRVTHPTFVRVAYHTEGERIVLYYDLGDDQRRVVKIDSEGYRICDSDSIPVRFIRTPGMLPAPLPLENTDGASFARLQEVFQLDREAAILVIAFVLSCANPSGIYPLLILQGMQGAGKSTLAEYVGRLVDEHSVPLVSLPSSEQDLVVGAMESHLLVFDNTSGISGAMSDALCRLATGGGFVTRKLYTNRGVERFSKTAPTVITGIESMTARNDLADRSIEVHLTPLGEGRRSAIDLRYEFDSLRPEIMGAWFSSLSEALARFNSVSLDWKPRMLDFARWVKAASGVLPFTYEEFEQAYRASIDHSAETNVEADPVASGVVDLMHGRKLWEGSMTDLQKEVGPHSRTVANLDLRKMTADLIRATPALRRLGYAVARLNHKEANSRRSIYRIEKIK